MDQQGHGQPPVMGGMGSMAQIPYSTPPYDPNQMVGLSPSGSAITSVGNQSTAFTTSPAQHQLACQQIQLQHFQQLQQQLQAFWANQYAEVGQTTDFRNHSLPLARIKKIMKADEDVRMIAAEAPVVFSKACEMFILELTMRSWNRTEENKRRTLQKNDIAAAITRTDIFDFLVDIVPREELKDELLGSKTGTMPIGGLTEPLPYYFVSPQHGSQVGSQVMAMGSEPFVDQSLYVQQTYIPEQMWQPQQQQQLQPQPQQQPKSEN